LATSSSVGRIHASSASSTSIFTGTGCGGTCEVDDEEAAAEEATRRREKLDSYR
jgi:hypothetical protein